MLESESPWAPVRRSHAGIGFRAPRFPVPPPIVGLDWSARVDFITNGPWKEAGLCLATHTHTHTPFYSLIYALTTLWHTPTNNTFGTWLAEVVLGLARGGRRLLKRKWPKKRTLLLLVSPPPPHLIVRFCPVHTSCWAWGRVCSGTPLDLRGNGDSQWTLEYVKAPPPHTHTHTCMHLYCHMCPE